MTYSYLAIGLLVTFTGCLSILVTRAPPRLVLTSGALAAPTGLGDIVFVPEYWKPVHLIGSWLSVEGLLFSFGNGCLIIAVASRFAPSLRDTEAFGIRRALGRLSVAMATGFAAFLLVWRGAAGPMMIMHAAFVGFAAIAILLHLRGTVPVRIPLICGMCFLWIYAVQTVLWHLLDPGFNAFWHEHSAYLGRLPFPPYLPVEEYLWALFYGAIWAALIFDAFAPAARARRSVT